MLRSIVQRLAYPNLVAVLALFIALSATAVAVAVAAGGTSARPVIAYTQLRTLAHGYQLDVTGPGRTRHLGPGEDPSVAPNGRILSSSALGRVGPALTLYDTVGNRLHEFFNDRVIATPLAWSPDSRYLAVLVQTNGRQVMSIRLVVIDTTTTTARTVATGVIRGASFDRTGADRLVYGQARSPHTESAVNLYTVKPDGSDTRQLTADGNSLLPLWTAQGIVYDREIPRRVAAVADQLWLLHDGHSTQLTHALSPARVTLVPLAASTNGNRLVAEYEGQGVTIPVAVQLSPRRVRPLAHGGTRLEAAGISRDGRTLLLERKTPGFPTHDGVVETVPFDGGAPTRIATGDSAAWNG